MDEFHFSRFGQTQPSFSPIFAAAFCDPTLLAHDSQRSSQACAVHREHFAQLALGHLSDTGKHLKDRELSSPQPKRTKRLLVELGEGPRRPAETAAHARQ
jgi:hypothetical protein